MTVVLVPSKRPPYDYGDLAVCSATHGDDALVSTTIDLCLKSSVSDPLSRVTFYDAEHQRRLVFLTNNFSAMNLLLVVVSCRHGRAAQPLQFDGFLFRVEWLPVLAVDLNALDRRGLGMAEAQHHGLAADCAWASRRSR